MKIAPLAAALVLALATAAPALAQHDDLAPARLQRLDDQAASLNFKIKHARAIEIAKANGMVNVREIDLRKGSSWKVEGHDAQGVKLEIVLSGHDGSVLKIERD